MQKLQGDYHLPKRFRNQNGKLNKLTGFFYCVLMLTF